LYQRFSLSLRDIEELLALRGITVSYEFIRRWRRRFGPQFARKLKRKQGPLADRCFLDKGFVNIQGRRHYLWRTIDQNGDVIGILLRTRRNARAAKRFSPKLLKGQQRSPVRLVTDKLGSYRVVHPEEMPGVPHDTTQYANNRIEASHRRPRTRERQMLGFRSVGSAQRFLSVLPAVSNLFNYARHHIRADQYRFYRARAFDAWSLASHA
jgi:putative transposase